ncbi:MAG: cysteine--tRNA ligase [Phycisphaeraceae bacterium]|nr:MAG: cysteine--tRNA ligase [Phycisphaeraceae bacterium]
MNASTRFPRDGAANSANENMPLEIHNTLTARREPFIPGDPGRVAFYTCGPTVYDYAHIGNFRAFLVADLARRWIESPLCELTTTDGRAHKGPRSVVHVMNMTDVGHMTDDAAADGGGEDKMEAAARRLLEAKKSGELPEGAAIDPNDPHAIAEFYSRAFLEDASMMGLKVVEEAKNDPTLMPRPTQMVREMIELVTTLLDKGCAYIASDGVCYFDTQSFPEYGKLSGNTLDKLRAGAGGRVSESNQAVKKHPADFMLWKPDPRHLMRWDPKKVLNDPDSPLKEGYPGWHLECSAMARARLGDVIDLHSGGEDNIFPHHECEIAQSRCATGQDSFARCWLHIRHLFVEGEKMSKSKGNFYTVRELVGKGFDPAAIRLELIRTHYRSNANFTEQGLRDSSRIVERWRRFVEAGETSGGGEEKSENAAGAERDFAAAMHDDLNVAGAIGVINAWINREKSPTRADAALMRTFDETLGVLEISRAGAANEPEAQARDSGSRSEEAAEIDSLIAARAEARKSKNFAEADRIRDELAAMGVEILDSAEGTKWRRKAAL